jgi:hypothetical protein
VWSGVPGETGADKGVMKRVDQCAPGLGYEPVIIHCSGGISADRRNICGHCAAVIWRWRGKYGYADTWLAVEQEPKPCPECDGFDDYCGDVALCETCGGKGWV